ncbi:hypothetical protein PMAYCL1PPCAC_32747, partial [Pristionchus mayeri]
CGCSLLRPVRLSVLRALLLLILWMLLHLLHLMLREEVALVLQWRWRTQIYVDLPCRIVDCAVVESTGFVAKDNTGSHHSSSCPAHSAARRPLLQQLLLLPLLQHRHYVVGRARDGQRRGRATGGRHGDSLLRLRLHRCSSLLHLLQARMSVRRLLQQRIPPQIIAGERPWLGSIAGERHGA